MRFISIQVDVKLTPVRVNAWIFMTYVFAVELAELRGKFNNFAPLRL